MESDIVPTAMHILALGEAHGAPSPFGQQCAVITGAS